MTSILIADDHALVRDGLRRIIEATPGFTVFGEAIDGDEVVVKVRAGGFDVLLLDMSMPGKSGLDLIRHVRSIAPQLPVLVLSMHAEDQYAIRAIRSGASGYLNKDSAPSQLVAALKKVAGGGTYISQTTAEQLALGLTPHARAELPHRSLSDREHEVFMAIVAGKSMTEIADSLNLSIKTVSTHKSRIMEKMRMDSVAELVRYAVLHRLTDAGPQA